MSQVRGHERFTDAGNSQQESVPTTKEGEEHEVDGFVLPNDDLVQFLADEVLDLREFTKKWAGDRFGHALC